MIIEVTTNKICMLVIALFIKNVIILSLAYYFGFRKGKAYVDKHEEKESHNIMQLKKI